MVSMGLAMAFPGLARARVQAVTRGAQQDLSLWYEQAAGPWVEALPVGNGRLGAMSFGRVAQERIQLNEDTLFAGGPYNPNNPAALAALPQVRALINLIEKLDGNIDLVGLVHIADVPGRHEPGTGEMYYTNIYKKLAELKYNRVICMEFRATGDWVKTLKTAREEAIAALKS